MKAIRSILGYMLAAIFILAVWGVFADSYGIAGGWFAALALTGTLWFVNHYVGLIPQEGTSAFVDMGLAIGLGGIARDVFSGGGMPLFIDTLPTIAVVVAGAVFGGILAGLISKEMDGNK